MKTYGLLGRNISYSFSRKYFSEKFSAEDIPAVYQNFDLQDISEFREVVRKYETLSGLNVTIPYKEKIIEFLDEMDPVAREIGAVNTIKFLKGGKLRGYNTDYYGFMESIKPYLQPQHRAALILGTGGASKAVAYALTRLGISYRFVSRSPKPGEFSYTGLSREHLEEFRIIINCTPLGTYPKTEEAPVLPVQFLGKDHLVYDLIYNPEITRLMQLAAERDATVLNGRSMLELQAEKAWEIWNR